MPRRLFPLLVLIPAFAVAVEEWRLVEPEAWSEDGDFRACRETSGTIGIVKGKNATWVLGGLPKLDVAPGDVFSLSCAVEERRSEGVSACISPGAVLYDAEGKVLSWSYARKQLTGGQRSEVRFAIPPGAAKMKANVSGFLAVEAGLKDIVLRRLKRSGAGSVRNPDLPTDWRLESAALRFVLFRDGATFDVKDRRTGRTWRGRSDVGSGIRSLSVMKAVATGNALNALVLDLERMRRFAIRYELAGDAPELVVTVKGEKGRTDQLSYPLPFASERGMRLILPQNEGMGYPVEESGPWGELPHFSGGDGLCMAFAGVVDDERGDGWMYIVETPDDAMTLAYAGELRTLGIRWLPTLDEFGSPRRLRYAFLDGGGHVAMAKRYRRWAKERGLFRSLAEKARGRPAVDRLVGAVNVWSDADALKIVSELRAAGVSNVLWSAGRDSNVVARLVSMPGVLAGKYDCYQDVYFPDVCRALDRKPDGLSAAWPRDIAWSGDRADSWIRAWGVRDRHGTWHHAARLCDSQGPKWLRRIAGDDFETTPYNCRMLDTTAAATWMECRCPRHPMSRSESRRWRNELLRVLGEDYGKVVGSETGHDAFAATCDYFEGMMSIVQWRIPDSGRDLWKIWPKSTPGLIRYQVGERYRLPLWELVYHDAVVSHWYWSCYNNKMLDIWEKRDLFNFLYGTAPMILVRTDKDWAVHREKLIASCLKTCPVARETGYSEMTDHRFLTKDRAVQRTVFANGVVLTVNFGNQLFTCPDGQTIGPGQGMRTRRTEQ